MYAWVEGLETGDISWLRSLGLWETSSNWPVSVEAACVEGLLGVCGWSGWKGLPHRPGAVHSDECVSWDWGIVCGIESSSIKHFSVHTLMSDDTIKKNVESLPSSRKPCQFNRKKEENTVWIVLWVNWTDRSHQSKYGCRNLKTWSRFSRFIIKTWSLLSRIFFSHNLFPYFPNSASWFQSISFHTFRIFVFAYFGQSRHWPFQTDI